jgi:hypothetical protein
MSSKFDAAVGERVPVFAPYHRPVSSKLTVKIATLDYSTCLANSYSVGMGDAVTVSGQRGGL